MPYKTKSDLPENEKRSAGKRKARSTVSCPGYL